MNKSEVKKYFRSLMFALFILLVLLFIGSNVWEGKRHQFVIVRLAIIASFFFVYFLGSYLSEEILFRGFKGNNLIKKKDNPGSYNAMLVSSLSMAIFFGILAIFYALK